MTHYMIISPEMSEVIPVLDDGTGPTEYFHCVCFIVAAPTRKDALKWAIQDPLMQPWVKKQRLEGKNPFSGLQVQVSQCKHGICYCDRCIEKYGECEECFKEVDSDN